jgi:23S rRNA (adenine2503-C2)-methyltransferase
MINLHAITLPELEEILLSWGHKKFRAKQVYDWVHVRGVVDVTQMNNIPKVLREQLAEFSSDGSLSLHTELVSKDGTIKRAYKLKDGYVIESVLMPYDDGRYTACISSQAGCAQQCVFCATGHGGFQRQLTVDEIFEQVSRFASELAYDDKQQGGGGGGDNNSNNKAKSHGKSKRLSNIVFMGMGKCFWNQHEL